MQASDLRPARDFAQNFGCKVVIYGGPGSGKTPVSLTTATAPVVLMSEPGFLSVRKSDAPTWPAFNPAKVDEFFLWFHGSAESRNYQTLVWDSASQSHEQRIEEELNAGSKSGGDAHGKRAYGVANRWMMGHLNKLYFMPQKHIVLITKMQAFEVNGGIYKRPYFSGQELPVRVPHLFDFVLQLGNFNISGVVPSPTRAFLCQEQFDAQARDRSGQLNLYEPPNLAQLFAKAMV